MIVTTWNNLIEAGISAPLTQLIEQKITGNRFVWGTSTPIPVSDILDYLGYSAAIFALENATVPTTGIQLAASQAMLDAWLPIWASQFPTDQLMSRLLVHTSQLASSTGAGAPPNRNACGDIVSTNSGVTSSSVLNDAANVQNLCNTLDATMPIQPPLLTTLVDPTDAGTPALLAPDGSHALRYIYDTMFLPVPTVLPGYIEHPLLEPNGAGVPTLTTQLLINENQGYISYASNHPPANFIPFATIQGNPAFAPGTIPNYSNVAVAEFGSAAIAYAQSVALGFPALSTVAALVDQSVANNAIGQRLLLPAIIYQLLQLTGNAVPVSSLLDYTGGSIYYNQLVDAQNAMAAVLFNTYAFWHAYDADLSGGLSVSERYNAQLGFNAALNSAVATAAYNLRLTLIAEQNTLVTQTSGIAAILRPYLL